MSEKYEITGVVHAIPPARTTSSGKSFGSFVLETELPARPRAPRPANVADAVQLPT